jgi:hypothetical protein
MLWKKEISMITGCSFLDANASSILCSLDISDSKLFPIVKALDAKGNIHIVHFADVFISTRLPVEARLALKKELDSMQVKQS